MTYIIPITKVTPRAMIAIHDMGYAHNLGITFNLAYFANAFRQPGYITMGDNNAFRECPANTPSKCGYDTQWFPIPSDVIGVARGEEPAAEQRPRSRGMRRRSR